jgi:replicative DNA helicase
VDQSELDVAAWGYSLEAEASVIGGLLLDNAVFEQVSLLVRDADFFSSTHREIFRFVAQMIENNRPADVLTVCELLQRSGRLDAVGGMPAVAEMVMNTPGTANIRRYAELVAERSLMRAMYASGAAIMNSVRHSKGRDARQLLDDAQAQVMAIRDATKQRGDFHTAGDLMVDVIEFVDGQHQKYADGTLNDVTGLATGFCVLDKRTTGLQPGQLVIVAARPAMGKSAFAINLAQFAAQSSQKMGLVFSLEMSLRELGLRMLASEAQVNVQRLVTGRVYENEWPRVTTAFGKLDQVPLAFCELGGLTVLELRTLARRAKREYGGLSLIVVDYLQLMIGGDDGANRAAQLSEITRGLKLLAKELQVPVVALSQLNRELEKRPNKRPTMADLRDSGSIEQDADLIWFIYRDVVYNPKTEEPNIAEIITGKQRNGPTGVDRLIFRGDFTRFSNEAADA